MKFLNKLQLLMLLSLLLGLQSIDAAKRGLDDDAAVSSSSAMVDEGDEGTGHHSWREGISSWVRSKVRRFVAKRFGIDEEVTGNVGASSSSFGALSSAVEALSQAMAASSVRSAGGAGAESAVAMGGAGGEVVLSIDPARINRIREEDPSRLPIPPGLVGVCASFLDKHSRARLCESSLTKSADLISGLKFKSNTPSAVVLSKIARCPKLKKLNLRMYQELAEFIEGLPAGVREQLEELDLEMSNVTAAQVSTILQHFPNLKKLNLGFCYDAVGFGEVLPAGAGKQLEELNLSMTGATAAQIGAIVQRCSNLKKLNLSFCPGLAGFVEELPEDIVLSLEELSLSNADQDSTLLPPGQVPVIVTVDQIREIVRRCPQLKKLDLSNCRGAAGFIEDLPADVGEQLEELNLVGTRATADQVRAIAQRCLNLKKLDLFNCKGSARFIEELPAGCLAKLEELNLSRTGVTADQVQLIVQRCLNLKKLAIHVFFADDSGLEGAAGLTGELPADCLIRLEELDLINTGATADQVRLVVQRCSNLKKLNLSHCPRAAGFIEGLAAGSGQQLEELHLLRTEATAGQVRLIVQSFPQLKNLGLYGCRRAAGFIEGLAAGSGQQLEELDLRLSGATASQVAAIRARFPGCKIRV